jgi:hypothetical protein
MSSSAARAKGKKAAAAARDSTVAAIERIREEREARRMSADRYHRDRKAEERKNIKSGKPGDVDFQRLIKQYRAENKGKARKVRQAVSGVHGRYASASTQPSSVLHVNAGQPFHNLNIRAESRGPLALSPLSAGKLAME